MSQIQQPRRGLGYQIHDLLFGTELTREVARTEDLYWRVSQLHAKSEVPDPFDMACGVCARFIEKVPAGLTGDFLAAVRDIIALEERILAMPEVDIKRLSMKEGIELRNFLRSKE